MESAQLQQMIPSSMTNYHFPPSHRQRLNSVTARLRPLRAVSLVAAARCRGGFLVGTASGCSGVFLSLHVASFRRPCREYISCIVCTRILAVLVSEGLEFKTLPWFGWELIGG